MTCNKAHIVYLYSRNNLILVKMHSININKKKLRFLYCNYCIKLYIDYGHEQLHVCAVMRCAIVMRFSVGRGLSKRQKNYLVVLDVGGLQYKALHLHLSTKETHSNALPHMWGNHMGNFLTYSP